MDNFADRELEWKEGEKKDEERKKGYEKEEEEEEEDQEKEKEGESNWRVWWRREQRSRRQARGFIQQPTPPSSWVVGHLQKYLDIGNYWLYKILPSFYFTAESDISNLPG